MYFNNLESQKAGEPAKERYMESGTEYLKRRVDSLLQVSRDNNFTQYLLQMRERIAYQERQINILADEFESHVRVYENNQRMRGQVSAAQQTPLQMVQPSMQQSPQQMVQPSMQQSPQQMVQPYMQQAPQQTVQPNMQQAPQQTVQPNMQQTPTQMGQLNMQQPSQQTGQPYMQQAPQQTGQPDMQQPPMQMGQTYMQQAPQQMGQPYMQQVVQPSQTAAKPKKNTEFAIGGAVLSIVGSAFILTAMVMLGLYFLQGLMKGLLLYVACIAVMLLSELLLYRRWPKLGMTFSAVGMGGLYIATMTNYLALRIFNQWVALGIALAITVGVIVLSRKRDAVSYRILGMVAMYVSMITILESTQYRGGVLSQAEWVTITVMAFIINVMCLAVPIRKAYTGISITHMLLNAVFILWGCWFWYGEVETTFASVSEMWHYSFFIAISILVMQLIFIAQIRWSEKQNADCPMMDNSAICVIYCLSGLMYLPLVGQITDFASLLVTEGSAGNSYLGYRLLCTGIAVFICLIPMAALRKRPEKWFAWYLLNLLVLVIHLESTDGWEICICMSILLALSKLLSFGKDMMVKYSDAVLTALACFTVLLERDSAYVIPLFIVLLLSVVCINYWHVYFETILTFTVAAYVAGHMLSGLRLPVFVGILFVGMLIFNNVERWRGKAMEIYNALMLIGQTICYLLLLSPVYRNAYLTYLCMLIFGIATIIICLQKKYHMDFSGKPWVLAIFMTYMGVIVRGSSSIINSILLMLTALVCVGMGFSINKRSVRIYGLVLSLLVCVKIVLYDFMEAAILQRTILFFVVGVLALVISAIYMILERNQDKRDLSKESCAPEAVVEAEGGSSVEVRELSR
ncbi:MAG: hypothetical protein NC413_02155 [Muribaculum sp.]|nr:hypothetical protein [Muribaculum sp.]